MDNHSLLSLEPRRRVLDCVADHPGVHLRDVARRCEMPLGTALYHLDRLQTGSLVSVRRDGRYKRYFSTRGVSRRERDLMSILRHHAPRRIALALLVEGARTQRELASTLDLSRSTLSFHVNQLVSAGVVERIPARPENRYVVGEPGELRDIMLRYRASLARSDEQDAALYRRLEGLARPTAPLGGVA